MKIVVITGSPHRQGTSALLADRFICGAQESGHEVFRFDAAFEDVKPCSGCGVCGYGRGADCPVEDAMKALGPKLLEADAVALVTPLYYFGFSAQMKRVIDRFTSYQHKYPEGQKKKSILLATAADDLTWTMNALTVHYQTLAKYMKWEDAGMVLATGCGQRSDIEKTNYPQDAYLLGKRLSK